MLKQYPRPNTRTAFRQPQESKITPIFQPLRRRGCVGGGLCILSRGPERHPDPDPPPPKKKSQVPRKHPGETEGCLQQHALTGARDGVVGGGVRAPRPPRHGVSAGALRQAQEAVPPAYFPIAHGAVVSAARALPGSGAVTLSAGWPPPRAPQEGWGDAARSEQHPSRPRQGRVLGTCWPQTNPNLL